jgi:hypothetical protein
MSALGSIVLLAGLRRVAGVCAALGLALPQPAAPSAPAPAPCSPIAEVAGVPVLRQEGSIPVVLFRSGMAIDVDGAPRAYHPHDRNALNRLAHAGRPGRWWALVTKDGQPVVQGPQDPAPGYYLSMTSLQNSAYPETDARRYVDATAVPYVALPRAVTEASALRLGDLVAVVNQSNGKVAFAIFADQGPKDKLGEGSLYLANRLRKSPVPDAIGVRQSLPRGIVYVLFPGSGNRRPKQREQIAAVGAKLFRDWGGVAAVKACLP